MSSVLENSTANATKEKEKTPSHRTSAPTPTKRKQFRDISKEQNGGVLKKLIKKGTSDEKPVEGCPCFIQYVGRLMSGEIFDTTRDVIDGKHVGGTDDPHEFQLKREKAIKGFDVAVASMNKGEIAEYVFTPDYAYEGRGFPPKVRPNVSVQYEIELLYWKDSLPKFPSKAELDQSKKEREAAARKEYEENPPPSTDEKIAMAEEEKLAGNKLFQEGKFEEAKKKYDSGFVNIYVGKDEWNHILSNEDKAKINKMKRVLHMNRSIVKLKMGKYEDALWDCDKSVALDPENRKGYWRRSKVYSLKVQSILDKGAEEKFIDVEKCWKLFRKALADLKKAKELQDKEIAAEASKKDQLIVGMEKKLRQQEKKLKLLTKKYEAAQKKLYANKIMKAVDKESENESKAKLTREQEELDAQDLPELEDD